LKLVSVLLEALVDNNSLFLFLIFILLDQLDHHGLINISLIKIIKVIIILLLLDCYLKLFQNLFCLLNLTLNHAFQVLKLLSVFGKSFLENLNKSLNSC